MQLVYMAIRTTPTQIRTPGIMPRVAKAAAILDGLYGQGDREPLPSQPLEEGGALNHLSLLQVASKG